VIASRGQFTGKEVLEMEATGYAPWHGKGVDDVTAIGMKAGYGVVAVDPKVVPLRSVLFIEGYGQAVAGDTGGAIKGHRIDLGFNTAREAYKFGRRPVRVYILSTPTANR
jgi:3D (Asp-Asp-Asp) domain-containing protein